MKGMKEYRELTEKLYKVPESVQQLIPVHKIAEDGIFLLENKPEGAEVLVDGEADGWLHVRAGKKLWGFVYKEYVKKKA